MDFLGNQTRMNFPGNRMGDGFSWESNGGCKKNNNNNNMIRLVPVRIESGGGRFSRKSNEHGFSRKSNEDEFSRKSNGGWIFMGIKWGLQIIIIIT